MIEYEGEIKGGFLSYSGFCISHFFAVETTYNEIPFDIVDDALRIVEQGVGNTNPYTFAPKVKLWKGKELYSLDFFKDQALILGIQLVHLPGTSEWQVLWNRDGRVMLYDLKGGRSIWDLPGIHANWGRGFFYANPPGKVFYDDIESIEDKDYERYKEYTVVAAGRSLVIPGARHWSLAV